MAVEVEFDYEKRFQTFIWQNYSLIIVRIGIFYSFLRYSSLIPKAFSSLNHHYSGRLRWDKKAWQECHRQENDNDISPAAYLTINAFPQRWTAISTLSIPRMGAHIYPVNPKHSLSKPPNVRRFLSPIQPNQLPQTHIRHRLQTTDSLMRTRMIPTPAINTSQCVETILLCGASSTRRSWVRNGSSGYTG